MGPGKMQIQILKITSLIGTIFGWGLAFHFLHFQGLLSAFIVQIKSIKFECCKSDLEMRW